MSVYEFMKLIYIPLLQNPVSDVIMFSFLKSEYKKDLTVPCVLHLQFWEITCKTSRNKFSSYGMHH